MTPEEQCRSLAARFVEVMSKDVGVELGYTQESVEWADGYVERLRQSVDAETASQVSKFVGAFLGECIIANYGGAWREGEGTWGVYFDEKNAAFPFAKVQKQFENGAEDSILGFYEVIPVVFADSIGR